MKSTIQFKNVIEAHLQQIAIEDLEFASKLQNEKKNLDDCITYILNTVKKSGCNGFTDDEIFGMAIHYYDEDNVEIGKAVQCNVIINQIPELTEDEKNKAKQEAINQVIAEEKQRLQKRAEKKYEKQKQVNQQSLF